MEISARNKQNRPFHLLIAAAGTGERTGLSLPKQYLMIGGRSILRRTIDRFAACEGLQSMTIIIDPFYENLCRKEVSDIENCTIAYGGYDRKSSVYNGLKSIPDVKDDDLVLVHDAARPFVSAVEIRDLCAACEAYQAASLACPVPDTLRQGNNNSRIFGTVHDRNNVWAMQTPQAFRYNVLKKAHEQANEAEHYTDDSMIVSAIGVDVGIVTGSRRNFKVTDAADIEWARTIIKGTEMAGTQIRTGTGYDVHAFAAHGHNNKNLSGDNVLRLCGISVPHDRILSGHSDADVGLHALTDAVLGAIGAGDIGDHFPPSDPQWKDKDSAHFLSHAVAKLHHAGGAINNLDITLICEAPKLFAYKDNMAARIAQICGLDKRQVNVKATTSEMLGFTGRKEGIAAQACATVSMPVQALADTLE